MTTLTRKAFLQEQLPELLNKLEANSPPSFGIMTAQHMVEHLTWIIKSSIKKLRRSASRTYQRSIEV